jgi:ATP-dependent DNA helicase RecQ
VAGPTPLHTLRQVFGYPEFRPQQQEIIEHVIAGGDAFVLMPTGGGKSLCYQLPALHRSGVGIVVSPLISLMKDQVDALRASGVRAAYYNSSLEAAEARRVLAALHAGELDLLYMAPERLMTPGFLARLQDDCLVALFAVDEAHCVSQWGHDFRPEYTELGRLRGLFPDVPIFACTATADPETRQDVRVRLGLADAPMYVAGFDRPNIRYTVRDKHRPLEQLLAFLRLHAGESGIVYCLSRKRTEQVAEQLGEAGVNAAAYHAGLDAPRRRRVQEAFQQDEIHVVVATVAFGMGIDKPDVRFVVHYDLPKNLESYYQETGRSGRDGLPAEALLLFGLGDAALTRALIEGGTQRRVKAAPELDPDDDRPPPLDDWQPPTDEGGAPAEGWPAPANDGPVPRDSERVRIELHKLNAMIGFAEALQCRRRVLLGYFGETLEADCGNCDVCLDPPERYDATEHAQMALSCVFRVGQRFGAAHVADVLRGAETERIARLGHDRLSTYGVGADLSRETWLGLLRQLVHLGYLTQDVGDYSVLKLTRAARALLRGEEELVLAKPRVRVAAASKRRKSAGRRGGATGAEFAELSTADAALFERLRALRHRLAEEAHVPAYVVFSDATLREMAVSRPAGEAELLEVSGVGAAKLERFGATFLAAISEQDSA